MEKETAGDYKRLQIASRNATYLDSYLAITLAKARARPYLRG